MNWIDTLPAIPLAIGLPVTRKDGQRGIIVDLSRMAGDTFNSGIVGVLSEDNAYGTQFWGVNFMRLDIADPQGFGYALRHASVDLEIAPAFLPLAAWIRGEVTDADRLALAQAIAELVGGGS